MPKTKAVLFDLDDALFDSTGLADKARKEACKSMVRAGLPTTAVKAYKKLNEIVLKFGSNYSDHFGALCNAYNITKPESNKIIAAGIVAYHNIKFLCLKPLPDVLKTLQGLKKKGLKLVMITHGRAVKQWDKILRLGIDGFFKEVYISDIEDTSVSKEELAKKALAKLGINPQETIWVGDRIDTDIATANKLGIVSVQLLHGKYRKLKPKNKLQVPRYKIKRISEVLRLI